MDRLILLDTHVLVWMGLEPARLSRPAQRALRSASRKLIADISLREIAMLASQGKVTFEREVGDWLEAALEAFGIETTPISPGIAARSTRIAQNFHGDPADQLIAATAIELDIPLITADSKLLGCQAVRTIW